MTYPLNKLSKKKKLLFYIITILSLIFLLELGLRVVFAYKVGTSILFYGTNYYHKEISIADHVAPTVAFHENLVGNYSKYFSNQVRTDYNKETGEVFKVSINSKGFRGKEFYDQKQTGVVRVVTLGASSTFGYHAKDNETYPYYLEIILNKQCKSDKSYEVVNLAIPHLTSNHILSLFLAEALPLNPDVVTFYEGVNDSSYILDNAVTGPPRSQQ